MNYLLRRPIASALGQIFIARQWTQAILGKTTKIRSTSRPTMVRNMARSKKEKLKIRAGIIARMGTTLAAIYRLLWQNRPSPRLGKSLISIQIMVWFVLDKSSSPIVFVWTGCIRTRFFISSDLSSIFWQIDFISWDVRQRQGGGDINVAGCEFY